MCGRYVSPEEAAIERFWHIGRRGTHPNKGLFNVAPTRAVPLLMHLDGGSVELLYARWGLIPSWWKKQTLPSLTFNARSEEAAAKPMWRESLKTQRCLMPAVGWYEWNEGEQVRTVSGRLTNQPYYHYSPNSEIMAFAGLYSLWEPPGGAPQLTCALLSRAAAPAIAHIHHRMPVVVQPDDYYTWLNPATPMSEVHSIIGDSREDFEGYRVSTRVNDIRNDFPELIERLREEANIKTPPRNQNFDLF